MIAEEFLDLLRKAIRLTDMEIEGFNAGALPRVPINQLKLARRGLQGMEEQVESKSLPPVRYRNFGLGQMIGDSWPLDYQLGELILEVEQLYAMLNINEELQVHVERIVQLLAERKFGQIESLTRGVRLSAQEMETALDEYGRTLVRLPRNAFKLMDIIPHHSEKASSWSVIMPLWTAEEGRSDLSLELTLIRQGDDVSIELDDIHVL